MDLHFVRFQREHFQEYVSWFADPELNKRLGPMDEDWLTSILEEEEEQGITWAVLLDTEMVGVIETVFDPEKKLPAAITAIAIKPSRRRQGLAKAILTKILSDHHRRGILNHIAYVSADHTASRKLLEAVGFVTSSAPDNNGYIKYQHAQPQQP